MTASKLGERFCDLGINKRLVSRPFDGGKVSLLGPMKMLVAGTVAPSLMRRILLRSLVNKRSSVISELFCLALGPDDAVGEVSDVASSLLRSTPRFPAAERFFADLRFLFVCAFCLCFFASFRFWFSKRQSCSGVILLSRFDLNGCQVWKVDGT